MNEVKNRKKTSTFQKILKLNWRSTPSFYLPHGLLGLVSTSIGLFLVFGKTVRGYLDPFIYIEDEPIHNNIPILVFIYVISTVASSVAGYRLSRVAFAETVGIFQRCAILQYMLCYFIVRFLPHTTQWIALLHNNYMSDIALHIETIIQLVDIFSTLVLVICMFSFNRIVFDKKYSTSIKIAVLSGTFGLQLLASYPMQISYNGQKYWQCVQERYPLQASGMVAFIYIPTSLTFNIILFGATLYQRKILTETTLGIGSMFIILTCIVSTVLSQEIHIPNVSTQRIYLPCEEPMAGTLESEIVKLFDFSRYARMILGFLFGLHFDDTVGNVGEL